MYPNLKKTFAYALIMQFLWIIFIITKYIDMWWGEFIQLIIICIELFFVFFLLSNIKIRCLKGTLICIGIYLCLIWADKMLAKENPNNIVFYSGIVFLFAMYSLLKRYWKFMKMLEQKYPLVYRQYHMYDLGKYEEKERYINDSVKEIMESMPSQNVKEVIEDVQATVPILFLCYEVIVMGTLFTLLL